MYMYKESGREGIKERKEKRSSVYFPRRGTGEEWRGGGVVGLDWIGFIGMESGWESHDPFGLRRDAANTIIFILITTYYLHGTGGGGEMEMHTR